VGNVGTSLSARVESGGLSPTSSSFNPSTIIPGGVADASISVGGVAKFNGRSSFVVVKNSTGLNYSNFSVETTFQYAALSPDKQMLFGKGAGGASGFFFYTFRSVNNINDFAITSDGQRADFQLGNRFQVGQWYDLTYSVGSSLVTAYVNGVEVQQWPRQGIRNLTNSDPVVVGNCSCGGYFFNGSVSMLRYYSTALSSSQVLQNYLHPSDPVTENLQLWLEFSKWSGGTIQDLSGHNRGGEPFGGVSLIPVLAPGSNLLLEILATNVTGTVFVCGISLPVPLS
jgi:hypothetical protein